MEKVAVFFPFVLSLNFRPGVKGVGKVGADGLLQPVNVFHAVVGILLVVDVVKLVKVLFVLAHVRKGRQAKKGRRAERESEDKNFFRELFHEFIIGRISFQIKSEIFSLGRVASSSTILMPLFSSFLYWSIIAR